MAENQSQTPDINPKHHRVVMESALLVERTKDFVANLRKDIERQEKILAKQRLELDKLLKDLRLKDNSK